MHKEFKHLHTNQICEQILLGSTTLLFLGIFFLLNFCEFLEKKIENYKKGMMAAKTYI